MNLTWRLVKYTIKLQLPLFTERDEALKKVEKFWPNTVSIFAGHAIRLADSLFLSYKIVLQLPSTSTMRTARLWMHSPAFVWSATRKTHAKHQ